MSKSLGEWDFWPTLRFTEDMTQLCLAGAYAIAAPIPFTYWHSHVVSTVGGIA